MSTPLTCEPAPSTIGVEFRQSGTPGGYIDTNIVASLPPAPMARLITNRSGIDVAVALVIDACLKWRSREKGRQPGGYAMIAS